MPATTTSSILPYAPAPIARPVSCTSRRTHEVTSSRSRSEDMVEVFQSCFSVYLDELLEKLSKSGVGCHWGGAFVGALCYADDIVLLAPCASTMRHMLNICDSYATSHGLIFNANKTQLICFRRCHALRNIPTIVIPLSFLDEVSHLGHSLTYNLDDKQDIIRAVKHMNRKAFSAVDPFTKCFLIKTYCLSLYGCSLWSLSSPSIRIIQVALNKLLRKLWNLPCDSHSGIVHCIAQIPAISNLLYDRFCSLFSSVLSSSSSLLRSILFFLHSLLIHLQVIIIHTATHITDTIFLMLHL